MKKKSAKTDEWKGMLSERTAFLVETTKELKENLGKFHDNVDKKFVGLENKIDEKFAKHNLHHEYVERKNTKIFLVLGTLAITSILLNPESIKYLWIIVSKFIGLF